MTSAYDHLHTACAALGTRLFTITTQDEAAGVTRRAYSSNPVDYPVSGTKPLTRDGWYDFCITGQQVFVANTTPEFARYFFDHALITSLVPTYFDPVWESGYGTPIVIVIMVIMAAGMAIFFVNLAYTLFAGRKAADNPWGEGATTLEWTLSSPPPFHQFNELPVIKPDQH